MENTYPRHLESEPLTCKIDHGRLVISIGIDVLALATECREPFSVYDPNKGDWRTAWKVTDALEFAKDVHHELMDEAEDGSSLVTEILDKAMEQALDQGSLGVEEGEPAWPEEKDSE